MMTSSLPSPTSNQKRMELNVFESLTKINFYSLSYIVWRLYLQIIENKRQIDYLPPFPVSSTSYPDVFRTLPTFVFDLENTFCKSLVRGKRSIGLEISVSRLEKLIPFTVCRPLNQSAESDFRPVVF